jgi:Cdc6-like AAA superfamily ATPase
MAIPNTTEDEFRDILSVNLTPSATIKTPERLFGRQKALKQIERALASSGRQVFIYGDRGVGKTSVALTTANIHNTSSHSPIYVVCSQNDTFAEIVRAIGNATVNIADRMEVGGQNASFGGSVAGFGANYSPSQKSKAVITAPESLNDALDIVKYVLSKRPGNVIIVIDEMERISDAREREKFAEFIKNIPELEDRVKFVFCGIATNIDELIGAHPSASRIIEPIHLERLHHNFLWDIISNVADKIGIDVEREALVRIGQISDGFPHYVHLIGESMFWNAFDDQDVVSRIRAPHFRAGIKGAIERAEAMLRMQYEKATMKTKNTEDYQEALWALADRTSDRRQLSEIYETSYRRIMFKRTGRRELPREKFNQRLLSLRREGHGSIIVGYGSGWFGFRENIMRGYVRLRAENEDVELGKDHAMVD